jgi:hypothetical protein
VSRDEQRRNGDANGSYERIGLSASNKVIQSSNGAIGPFSFDPLLTPEQVAEWLNTSVDWVHDHSSRKEPRLPVIRLGGGPGRAGLLRYRASAIRKFIDDMEELSRPKKGGI